MSSFDESSHRRGSNDGEDFDNSDEEEGYGYDQEDFEDDEDPELALRALVSPIVDNMIETKYDSFSKSFELLNSTIVVKYHLLDYMITIFPAEKSRFSFNIPKASSREKIIDTICEEYKKMENIFNELYFKLEKFVKMDIKDSVQDTPFNLIHINRINKKTGKKEKALKIEVEDHSYTIGAPIPKKGDDLINLYSDFIYKVGSIFYRIQKIKSEEQSFDKKINKNKEPIRFLEGHELAKERKISKEIGEDLNYICISALEEGLEKLKLKKTNPDIDVGFFPSSAEVKKKYPYSYKSLSLEIYSEGVQCFRKDNPEKEPILLTWNVLSKIPTGGIERFLDIVEGKFDVLPSEKITPSRLFLEICLEGVHCFQKDHPEKEPILLTWSVFSKIPEGGIGRFLDTVDETFDILLSKQNARRNPRPGTSG